MIERHADLTAEQLRALLHYDPATGVFTWLVDGRKRLKGSRAGSVNAKTGYRSIQIARKFYKASRLAHLYMTGSWPADDMDHRNRDRADDRWRNLRPATHSQNMQNTALRKDSSSGVRGVSWREQDKQWTAYIGDPATKRRKYLGQFNDKAAAIAARQKAEAAIFGGFRVGA